MKEKYSFGWLDPRATYGSPDTPDARWEFLERHQYNIAAVAIQLIGVAAVLLVVVL